MASRKPYTREFKLEAINLVTEQGLSRMRVARDLGVDIGTLRRWLQELEADGTCAIPGHAHARDEELARLRRENEVLRQERDILKKAVGIFSRMPQ